MNFPLFAPSGQNWDELSIGWDSDYTKQTLLGQPRWHWEMSADWETQGGTWRIA